MKQIPIKLLLILSLGTLIGCKKSDPKESLPPTVQEKKQNENKKMQEDCLPQGQSLELLVKGVEVSLLIPQADRKGTLLLLPGWNYDRKKWCRESSICQKALQNGYILILPEMGKSIYASQYYSESRPDWTSFPTRSWLTDTLVPYLQEKYCILNPGQNNFILGLSTGGRGVALTTLYLPEIFTAAAALSGDYDQRLLPNDNLMRGIYGSYEAFPERWEGVDNPAMQAAKFQTPLYLGHGRIDAIAEPSQTQHFYDVLREKNPKLPVQLNMVDNMGHDFNYWDAEVDNVLGFFQQYQNMP